MLQKTFFASKGTKNLVEYPKPGRDFSTKSRKRSGERRSGAGNRTHAARGKKRPAASAGRQTGRERLYAGHPPTGPGDRHRGRERGDGKEGTGKRARPGACGNPPGDRTSPGGEREPRTEEAPHKKSTARKKPRTRESPAQTRKNPARKEPRTRESPARENVSHEKKSRAEGTRTGDHFAQFAQGKNPHGSGKYQR